MDKVVINAEKRTVLGKKVAQLRREGKIPGVIYGHHMDSESIVMDARELTFAIAGLSPSSIVIVKVGDEEHAALIREKQRDYIRNKWTHIDFQAVSLTEKIRVKIEVELTGNAPAEKNFNGIVLQDKEYIEVEALPNDLPEKITVDISGLNNIGDSIRISDLKISDKVAILDRPDETIVSIQNEAKEEVEETATAEGTEAAVAATTTEASEPEVVEKGKKEEEDIPEDAQGAAQKGKK